MPSVAELIERMDDRTHLDVLVKIYIDLKQAGTFWSECKWRNATPLIENQVCAATPRLKQVGDSPQLDLLSLAWSDNEND